MINVKIRPFFPEDIEQVIDLLQEVSIYRPGLDMLPCLARNFLSPNSSYACVATQNKSVIAFGSLFILNRLRGRSAIIEDVVVAATMRGQGIGRLVLNNLMMEARKQGCFKITLEASETGRGFCLALGFKNGGNAMKCLL